VHIVRAAAEQAKAQKLQGSRCCSLDALTGLHNEKALRARGPELIERAMKRGIAGCVVMMDLNGLQAINDALGEERGDKILTSMAALLRNAVKVGDFVARIGSDEFVLILQDLARADAGALLSSLHTQISALWPENAVFECRGISAGVAWFPEEGHSLELLLVQADFRMHIDKRNKKTEELLRREALEAREGKKTA